MNRRYGIVMLVALVAALILNGSALAEGRATLLGQLFPDSTPGKAARALVEPMNLTRSEGPYSLTVDEILFDGNGLYVRWTARSSSEDLVLFTATEPQSASVAFRDGHGMSFNDFLALGGTLDGESVPNEYCGLASAPLTDGETLVPFEVTIRGFFIKPLAPVVSVSAIEEGFYDRPTWIAKADADQPSLTFCSSFTPVENGYMMGKEALAPYLYTLPKDPSYGEIIDIYMTGITEQGSAQLLAEINLTFTVTPDAAHIYHTKITGQSEFDLDDRTITFSKANFTAARYTIEMLMTAKDDEAKDFFRLNYMLNMDGKRLFGNVEPQTRDALAEYTTIKLTYEGVSPAKTPSTLYFEAFWDPEAQQDSFNHTLSRSPERDITLHLAKEP